MAEPMFEFPPHGDDAHDDSLLRRSARTVGRQFRAIGFWAAVTLPFLYVPLLLVGLDSRSDTIAFVVLFTINLIALVLGHDHGTE